MAREQSLIAEAKETVERLEAETASLANTARLAGDFEQKALAAHDEAEARTRGCGSTPQRAHHRHGRGARAPARACETQRHERHEQIAKLERQLDRAGRPDPRDRRPRSRRLQAEGRLPSAVSC